MGRPKTIVPALLVLAAACGNDEVAEEAAEDVQVSTDIQDRADSPDPRRIDPCQTPLVDLAALAAVDAEGDPFADRPADPSCFDWAIHIEPLAEEMAYSIYTGGCDYLTASAPLLFDVRAGDTLGVRLWHFALTASSPATAHAALRIGAATVFEETVPIPSESGMIAPTWIATGPLPKGTPVYFHLHNHGQNSWAFLELVRTHCQ